MTKWAQIVGVTLLFGRLCGSSAWTQNSATSSSHSEAYPRYKPRAQVSVRNRRMIMGLGSDPSQSKEWDLIPEESEAGLLLSPQQKQKRSEASFSQATGSKVVAPPYAREAAPGGAFPGNSVPHPLVLPRSPTKINGEIWKPHELSVSRRDRQETRTGYKELNAAQGATARLPTSSESKIVLKQTPTSQAASSTRPSFSDSKIVLKNSTDPTDPDGPATVKRDLKIPRANNSSSQGISSPQTTVAEPDIVLKEPQASQGASKSTRDLSESKIVLKKTTTDSPNASLLGTAKPGNINNGKRSSFSSRDLDEHKIVLKKSSSSRENTLSQASSTQPNMAPKDHLRRTTANGPANSQTSPLESKIVLKEHKASQKDDLKSRELDEKKIVLKNTTNSTDSAISRSSSSESKIVLKKHANSQDASLKSRELQDVKIVLKQALSLPAAAHSRALRRRFTGILKKEKKTIAEIDPSSNSSRSRISLKIRKRHAPIPSSNDSSKSAPESGTLRHLDEPFSRHR